MDTAIERAQARYERLHASIERRVQALSIEPGAPSLVPYERGGLDLAQLPERSARRLTVLLAAEQRAWVNAYGSSELRTAALGSSGTASGHSFLREWLERSFDGHIAQERARGAELQHGALYARRLPGSSQVTHFIVVEGAAGYRRAVELERSSDAPSDAFSRTRPMIQWMVARAEALATAQARSMPAEPDRSLDHRLDVIARDLLRMDAPRPVLPQARAYAFLGIEDNRARFMVEVDGRKRLQTLALGEDGDRWRSNFPELNRLAMPADRARALVARYELLERLEGEYQKVVRPLDRGAGGRIDRILTNAKGEKSAVILGANSLHLAKLPAEREREARALIGRSVKVTRSAKGLSLSVGPSLGRRILRRAGQHMTIDGGRE